MNKYNRRTFLNGITTVLGVLVFGKNTVFTISRSGEKTLQFPN
jgi:hypothetical protein